MHRRSAFTPESLAEFCGVIDHVREQLIADGIFSPAVLDSTAMRTMLARKAFAFAGRGWSDIQIGHMLSRALRNAASEARHQRAERLRQHALKKDALKKGRAEARR